MKQVMKDVPLENHDIIEVYNDRRPSRKRFERLFDNTVSYTSKLHKGEVPLPYLVAFHGSSADKWHSIVQNGVYKLSHTQYMTAGAAHGPGECLCVFISGPSSLALSLDMYSHLCFSLFLVVQGFVQVCTFLPMCIYLYINLLALIPTKYVCIGIYTAPRYATSHGYSNGIAPVAICEIIRTDGSRNFISVENTYVSARFWKYGYLLKKISTCINFYRSVSADIVVRRPFQWLND